LASSRLAASSGDDDSSESTLSVAARSTFDVPVVHRHVVADNGERRGTEKSHDDDSNPPSAHRYPQR
jgi:hypothetical protein